MSLFDSFFPKEVSTLTVHERRDQSLETTVAMVRSAEEALNRALTQKSRTIEICMDEELGDLEELEAKQLVAQERVKVLQSMMAPVPVPVSTSS